METLDVSSFYKEVKTINEEEKRKNERIYLASVAVIRRLYQKQVVDIEILRRLNQKNAETMKCLPIDFMNYS